MNVMRYDERTVYLTMTGPCGSDALGTTGMGRSLASDVISDDIVMMMMMMMMMTSRLQRLAKLSIVKK